MHPMERIIGEAIMTGEEPFELALARVACNAYATQRVFCPRCGDVLDQERVTVLEGPNGEVRGACRDCAKPASILRAWQANRHRPSMAAGRGSQMHTWSGTTVLD